MNYQFIEFIMIFFYSDIDGVLKSANGTEYGLASGVFTKDLSKVWFNFFKASFFSVILLLIPCKERHAVESLVTHTLVNGQLYLQLAALTSPHFLNSHTNSVFLHSHKWPAPVTDTCIMS